MNRNSLKHGLDQNQNEDQKRLLKMEHREDIVSLLRSNTWNCSFPKVFHGNSHSNSILFFKYLDEGTLPESVLLSYMSTLFFVYSNLENLVSIYHSKFPSHPLLSIVYFHRRTLFRSKLLRHDLKLKLGDDWEDQCRRSAIGQVISEMTQRYFFVSENVPDLLAVHAIHRFIGDMEVREYMKERVSNLFGDMSVFEYKENVCEFVKSFWREIEFATFTNQNSTISLQTLQHEIQLANMFSVQLPTCFQDLGYIKPTIPPLPESVKTRFSAKQNQNPTTNVSRCPLRSDSSSNFDSVTVFFLRMVFILPILMAICLYGYHLPESIWHKKWNQ